MIVIPGSACKPRRRPRNDDIFPARTTLAEDANPEKTSFSRLATKPEPLVRNVGRGAGQSQDRWIHLLGPVPERLPEPVRESRPAGARSDTRFEELEARVAALEAEIVELREQLGG